MIQVEEVQVLYNIFCKLEPLSESVISSAEISGDFLPILLLWRELGTNFPNYRYWQLIVNFGVSSANYLEQCPTQGGVGTLIFSYIRRLGSFFFWFKNLNFNISGGFQKKIFFGV